MKKSILKWIAAAGAGCIGLAVCGGEPPPRPNVIFILTDDMGCGDLGVYGGEQGSTPNIDRLASEGTRFTQFYVASPICSPSRVAFTTGMFPARANINTFLQKPRGNRICEQADWLDPAWPTLARTLKQAGYATAHFGKWHMGGGHGVENAPAPSAYGYDEYHLNWESSGPFFEEPGKSGEPVLNSEDGKKYYRYDFTKYWVDRSVDFIRRHKDQPFYLELWPQDVHTPWIPNEDSLCRTAVPGLPRSQHNLRAVLNEYDRQLGRFLDALRELGVETNTLIVFSADNGPDPSFDHARTLGMRGMKKSLYEGGTCEPFIVRWPGRIPAGKVNGTSVLSSVDYFPTVCSLAGVKPPDAAAFDGEDMSRVWLGSSDTRTRLLFWEYGRKPQGYSYPPDSYDKSPNVAVRDGAWKLLVNADGSGAELYDLDTDPMETKNLADQYPERVGKLKEQVLDWRKSLP